MDYQSAAREQILTNPTITGGTITGATVGGITTAQQALVANGAKAVCSITLVAYGPWSTENLTIPGMATKTATEMGALGSDEATDAALIGAYISANSTSVDFVSYTLATRVMVLQAKSYGSTLNEEEASGTLLSATVEFSDGADPISASAQAAVSALVTDYVAGWRPWVPIGVFTATGGETEKDFNIAPSDWRELMFKCVDMNCAAVLRIDGTKVSQKFTGWNYAGNASNVDNPWIIADAAPVQGEVHVDCRSTTGWPVKQVGGTVSNSSDHKSYTVPAATTTIGISAFNASSFNAGVRIELWGVPDS